MAPGAGGCQVDVRGGSVGLLDSLGLRISGQPPMIIA